MSSMVVGGGMQEEEVVVQLVTREVALPSHRCTRPPCPTILLTCPPHTLFGLIVYITYKDGGCQRPQNRRG